MRSAAMKATFAIAVMLLVGACSTSSGADDSAGVADATQKVLVEAFLAQDVDAAVATYAEDIEFFDTTFGNHLSGKASLASQANTVFAWTDAAQTELVDRFVSDDGASGAVVYHWIGTHYNGTDFDIDMTQVHEYEDGLVRSITNYYGNSDVYEQLAG